MFSAGPWADPALKRVAPPPVEYLLILGAVLHYLLLLSELGGDRAVAL